MPVKEPNPISGSMMSIKHKLLAALGIVVVALLVFAIYAWYGNPSDKPISATTGTDPELVEAETRWIPSVSLAEPAGWGANDAPVAGEGLRVTRFAAGLDHPRTMLALPNGDILVAETNGPPQEGGGITGFFKRLFMDRVGAGVPSPDRIMLLRDSDGDGQADQRSTFRSEDLSSPSGMAYGEGRLYIANHDAVLAFDFEPGPASLTGEPEKLMDLPGGGDHWMRALLLSPDNGKLYVAVGSATNIADSGLEAEQGRAAIWEIDTATGQRRQFAGGLRNPNAMAWNPSTEELWTVVNERDMIGPDLVPDYLTNVPVGAQYGWPWIYWKDQYDDRVDLPMPLYMNEYVRRPEYALGAHTAPLGMLFSTGGNRMGTSFGNGAFIARHGSWNRKPPSGYDVIFVPFDAYGNPQDGVKQVLTGFLTDDGGEARGRPVWLAWDGQGGLLVSDDTAGIIWRVIAPGAEASEGPAPVEVDSMPPVKNLQGDPNAQFKGSLEDDYATY